MNRLLLLPIVLLALPALACGGGAPTTPTPAAPTPTATVGVTITPVTGDTLRESGDYLVDVGTGQILNLGRRSSVLWSPDGTAVARKGSCDEGAGVVDLVSRRTTCVFAEPARALAWSPDGGRLVFTDILCGADSGGDLFVVNRDGTDMARLATVDSVCSIAWSPDADIVAFTDPQQVQLLDLSTRQMTMITREVGQATYIPELVWSPGGEYLAFGGDYRPAGWLLYVYSVTKGELTEVGRGWNSGFAWSPDGQSLAVADETGLHLYEPLTGDRRRLASGAATGPLLWSPDGTTVAFAFGEPLPFIGYEGQASRQSPHLASIDQPREPRPLPPARALSWSPDGRRLAYTSEGCITAEWDVYLANADGSAARRLTNTPDAAEEGPFWSPSGQHLAYSTLDELVLFDAESGQSRVLARRFNDTLAIHLHTSEWLGAGWSPDGEHIAFLLGDGHGVCD